MSERRLKPGPIEHQADIPIYNARVIVAGLDRRTDMCVDPERPEGIVQVECDQFGKWQAVGEGRGGHGGIFERLSVLAFGAHHDEEMYSEKKGLCGRSSANENVNQSEILK